MAEDYLPKCPVEQVAGWYRRLADAWSKNMPELQRALAGTFLRAWVDNRNPNATIQFDAPPHLKASNAVVEVQAFHRDVFLTARKARLSGGSERWTGVLPRIQGAPGYPKWNLNSPLPLEHENQSKAPDAVRPEDTTLPVYHRNAKRLEDAGQAVPYNVVLRRWTVGDQRVAGPATIHVARWL